MSTSCVFRKKWPSDLNLARSWSLDVWSELNFFQNFAKNPWNWAYFVQKKITNKFPLTIWVHLVPRFFPEFLKIWPLVELTLSEYENIPGTPTQYNFWPILFQIFYWSFFCSPFWSISKKPTQKIAKTQNLGCKNQKNGDISAPDGQNFSRFFLSCFSSKNTSFKKNESKIEPTPTQPGPKHAKSFNLRKNP